MRSLKYLVIVALAVIAALCVGGCSQSDWLPSDPPASAPVPANAPVLNITIGSTVQDVSANLKSGSGGTVEINATSQVVKLGLVGCGTSQEVLTFADSGYPLEGSVTLASYGNDCTVWKGHNLVSLPPPGTYEVKLDGQDAGTIILTADSVTMAPRH